MSVKRVSPEEARDLMQKEGYVYLDVRSIPEFAGGHPTGAFNIPLAHRNALGMTPNPDFLADVAKNFPKDAKIVVGCKSGGRSLHAATLMLQAGYTGVIDQRAGFEGGPEPGWRPKGLPISVEAAADHTYDRLKVK